MVKFSISFLVSFDNRTYLKVRQTPSSLSPKSKLSKVCSVESAISTKTRLSWGRNSSSIKFNKPQNHILIGQPFGFLHGEYEILPKKLSYCVDFIYYGSIVRLVTVDGSIARRVLRLNKYDFCLFTLNHFIQLSDEEIIQLHSNICKIKFFNIKSRCHPACFKNVSKIWYFNEQDPDTLFSEVFSSLKQMEERLKHRVDDQFRYLSGDNLGLQHLTTKIEHTIPPVHHFRVQMFINAFKENKNAHINFPEIPEFFESLLLSSETKRKNKTKNSYNEAVIASLQFPGEMFFADPRCIDLHLKSQLTPLKIFVTAQQLLTYKQRILFNPLVITISEVVDLPEEYLQSLGYEKIFVEYSNNLIGEVRTHTKPLSKKITFNESRAFLTHNIDRIDFVKFIQTNRLRVEVRGLKKMHSDFYCKPQLFGSEFTDQYLSARPDINTVMIYRNTFNAPEYRDNLLCVTALVNNGLLLHRWAYFYIQACVNTTVPNENMMNIDFPMKMKQDELNLVVTESSVLKQNVLFSTDTCITLGMNFSCSLKPYIVSVLSTKIPLNRLFLIFYDETLATDIYNAVTRHNMGLLSKQIIMEPPDQDILYFPHDNDKLKFEEANVQYRQVITGFIIDNMRSYYMFFEGPAVGFIQHIWHSVMLMDTKLVRVYFDSDLIFNTRLYQTLMNTTGIYNVTLHEPLEILFKMSFTFMKGNLTLPCSRAVLKLDLMIKSEFIQQICQLRLCPTLQELISLNDEFGVWLTCARINPYETIPGTNNEDNSQLVRRGTYLTLPIQGSWDSAIDDVKNGEKNKYHLKTKNI